MTNIEKLKSLQAKMDYGGGDRVLIIDQYRKALRAAMPALIAVAEAARSVSADHNGPYLMSPQEKIQANEDALKRALAELEGVKL